MAFSIKKSTNSKVLTFHTPKERRISRKEVSKDGQDTVTRGISKITLSEKRIPPEINYISNLKASARFFALSQKDHFAVADCDSKGNLNNKYCLLQMVVFSDNASTAPIFLCSCEEYTSHRARLLAINHHIDKEQLSSFIAKEKALQCIHVKRLDSIDIFRNIKTSCECDENSDDEDNEEVYDKHIDQLCASPLIIAAYSRLLGYGLLNKDRSGKARMHCSTCVSNVYSCDHIMTYKKWVSTENATADLDINLTEEDSPNIQAYSSISKNRIDFPLSEELKNTYDEYERQERLFPSRFVPEITEECCEHGFTWDTRDPIEMRWIVCSSVVIHKSHISINSDDSEPRVTYYIPTTGSCKCRLQYDGQSALLFNLDNKNLVYYGVLFQYLHTMVETGSPLVSMHRHFSATNRTMSNSDVIPLTVLRRSWNAFARLLNIRLEDSFQCSICGPTPDIVICDATDVGMRKDFLPNLRVTDSQAHPVFIQGIPHKDRTYIKTAKTRKIILKLSGESTQQSRRKLPTKPASSLPLSPSECREVIGLLKSESRNSLASIVEDVIKMGQVPTHLRLLFAELGRNTPVYGLVQTGGNQAVNDTLKEIVRSGKNVTQSIHSGKMILLLEHVPVIGKFLSGCPDIIPANVCQLLSELLDMCERIHKENIPDQSMYSEISEKPFDVFPTMPLQQGTGRYKADSKSEKQKDQCRKESWGHPTLSPGIFTIYCQHGICYGFSVLSDCESPKHPFEIFRQRFKVAPKIIIYDNACKLHQYCLLREPAFFKYTLFLVDRFHWKGHVACSIGYNMCVYLANLQLRQLNSQVNEQGNAGVQKLKGHLSYMTFENFKFHVTIYYAVRNLNVLDGLTGV